MTEQKFILQTKDDETGELRRDVYVPSQIKAGLMFSDGLVIYANDKIPDLDRKSLGWDGNLVGKTLRATWIVNRMKSSFNGYVESYDNNSKTHTVKWDDKTVNSFDVMGRWQKGMLPMIEWRLLCDEEVPSPQIPVVSKRTERANKNADDGGLNDLTSIVESFAEGEKRPRSTMVGGGSKTGKRVKMTDSTKMLPAIRDKDCLQRLGPKEWLDDEILEFSLQYGCEATLHKKPGLSSAWNIEPMQEPLNFSVFNSFAITYAEVGKLQGRKDCVIGGCQNLSEKLPEFLVFPINYAVFHWAAAIVWLATEGPQKCSPCILYLDSGEVEEDAAEKKGVTVRMFLNYIVKEAKRYTRENLPLFRVKVPKQKNSYDCGLFALHMIYLFLMSRDKRGLAFELKEGRKENWFHHTVPGILRHELRENIASRFAELQPTVKPSEKKRLRDERSVQEAVKKGMTVVIDDSLFQKENEEARKGVMPKSLEQVMLQAFVLSSDEGEDEEAAHELERKPARGAYNKEGHNRKVEKVTYLLLNP